MADGPHDDRRSQPRLRCEAAFAVAPMSRAGAVDRAETCEVLDISACGIGLRCRRKFEPGDHALIGMTSRLGRIGVVGLTFTHARSEGGGRWLVGARFMQPPAHVAGALQAHRDQHGSGDRRRASA